MDVFKRLKQLSLYCFCTSLLIFAMVNPAEARTFNMVNHCDFPVWFGVLGGSGSGGSNPVPPDGNYKLDPGASRALTIPSNQWSGVFAGRTNCTSNGCETADCGGGTGACPRGFNQPATQAEFTVNANGNDYYDVEVINGVNIPISVKSDKTTNANDPYRCGAPGAGDNPSAGLGACSWQFNAPLIEYNWVTPGGNKCTSQSDCSGDSICGLSFNAGQQQLLQKTCGRQLGYWSANQICGVQRNYGAPFYCSDPLPPPQNQNGHTWWNLYACVDVGSCYQGGAGPDCCGCVNWDTIGLPVPPGPTTHQCVNKNTNWISKIQPTLEWMKAACPTLYTYPYDDVSSSFICQNTANYTITFCPNGGNPNPPNPNQCLPPTNIKYTFTEDKTSATITWDAPVNSDTVNTYQVNDYQNRMLWTGIATSYTDNTLPGTDGTFTYFLLSNCPSGQSSGVKVDVVVKGNPPPPNKKCLPPANVRASVAGDKRSVTLTWEAPTGSDTVSQYKVMTTCENRILWTGTDLRFTDTTLPGTSGHFSYALYSICPSGTSDAAFVSVDTLTKLLKKSKPKCK